MNMNRPLPTPAVIWLTGLSASGKTTIACSLKEIFLAHQIVPVLLDGDEMRQVMKIQGFDESSRRKHNLNIGHLASLLERQGQVVIVALISPYAGLRNEVRALCKNFIEVYIATDLATCIRRDPKGLYRKALAGEIDNFTGISAPYEAPAHPELTIGTVGVCAEECATAIYDFYLATDYTS